MWTTKGTKGELNISLVPRTSWSGIELQQIGQVSQLTPDRLTMSPWFIYDIGRVSWYVIYEYSPYLRLWNATTSNTEGDFVVDKCIICCDWAKPPTSHVMLNALMKMIKNCGLYEEYQRRCSTRKLVKPISIPEICPIPSHKYKGCGLFYNLYATYRYVSVSE